MTKFTHFAQRNGFLMFLIVLFIGFGLLTSGCGEDSPTANGNGNGDEVLHSDKYFMTQQGDIYLLAPSAINVSFQVLDDSGRGVYDLTVDDFIIYEDNETVLPSESKLDINKADALNYELKTVLMLDNSGSVGDSLPKIKSVAITMVNQISDYQKFAVFTFSERILQIMDFTDNVSDLTDAINTIELGSESTNLYGAVIEGVSKWQDYYSLRDSMIVQGILVLLTDGRETTHLHTLDDALTAIENKRVYTIGVGPADEVDRSSLVQLGNAGSFTADDFSQLEATFESIQKSIDQFANSFYWLHYFSPTRDFMDHDLELRIKDNQNSENSSSTLLTSFNSKWFYSKSENDVVSYRDVELNDGDRLGDLNFISGALHDPDGVIKCKKVNGWTGISNDFFNSIQTDGVFWNIVIEEAIENHSGFSTSGITSSDVWVADDGGKFAIILVQSISNSQIKFSMKAQSGSFEVQNDPPDSPYNPTPADDAYGVVIETTLSWSCSDPDGDALSYDVYFGTSSNPSLVVEGYRQGSYQPEDLDCGTTYYWKIVATDNLNASTVGSVWRFTTTEQGAQPPVIPYDPHQADNGSAHGDITLSWSCSDPDGDPVTYDVYLGNSEDPTIEVSSNQTETTYSAGQLQVDTEYYWKIIASDNHGHSTTGPVWSFTNSPHYPGEEQSFELLGDVVTITMCWIPAGEFMMGRQDGEQASDSNESPRHRVTFAEGFWIGKYEVTQEQWEAVMGNNPAHDYGVGDDYPVYLVSWNDIQDFELALGNSFRLPSEAEWEYACRGGTTTRFYWGDDSGYVDTDRYAVYYQGCTAEVGTKLPNAWNLYDMSGNVWEWCEDWWNGSYNGAPDDGSAWESGDDSRRVLRGGSWDRDPRSCRSADRARSTTGARGADSGFRLVFSSSVPSP